MLKFIPALLLILSPGLAFAECAHPQQDAAISCAEGTQLDAATKTCVAVTG